MSDEDLFWFDKPSILLDIDKLKIFCPSEKMTFHEKMNAIVRLSFYLSLLLWFITKNYLYLYIFLAALLITYLLYKNNQHIENLLIVERKKEFVTPDKENPFMNVLMSDYTSNPTRKTIPINPTIKKEIDKGFNHNLYKDVSDVFEKSNSQRQYYTNPSTTIPNDQESFSKWLYKVPTTCKSGDGIKCADLQSPNKQLSNQLYRYT